MSSCDWGFSFEAMKTYHDTEWGILAPSYAGKLVPLPKAEGVLLDVDEC